ncbi:MAG TPA: C-terminal binding protein [Gemmataceae bacterium]|nr:C-terminal binding protein [Gemmataceae bacterium]
MPKVLVTDHTFDPLDIEQRILEPLGAVLDAHQCKTAEQLLPVVADADAVLTQFSPVNAQVIAAMKNVRVIVRYGIGVDNVDLEAAKERGIPVCNVPSYCIDEVADHTLAFILAVTRQVVPNCLGVRGGQWGLAVPLTEMKTLRDLTVGVVGFGRIGREVVRRLRSFGGLILVFDPAVGTKEIESAGASAAASLDELLPQSDIITLHCPSTAQTRRMLDATRLGHMKRGSILVNLARGDLVDTNALVAALQTGLLAAAALDVCDPEPIPPGHPLLQMPNVLVAAHVASASARAARTLRETAAGMVVKRLRGEALPNVVNGVPT